MRRDGRTAGRGEPSTWTPGLQRGTQTSWALVQSVLRWRRWPETLTAWHTRATHGSRQETRRGQVEGGSGKVSWGKAPKGPERGHPVAEP